MKHQLPGDVHVALGLATPDFYAFHISSNWGNRFKDSALQLTHFKLAANLECNTEEKTYPDTFKAELVFADRVAVEAKVECDYNNSSLDVETNLLASVTDQISVGFHLQYNDKAKTLIKQEYGIFLRPYANNFLPLSSYNFLTAL